MSISFILFSALIACYFAEVDQPAPGTMQQLIYFDGRGRAEQFRIFFADQQIRYQDVRLTGAEFGKLKKSLPWGHLPVFNVTGKTAGTTQILADTAAMNVWIGKYAAAWPHDRFTEEILLDYSAASEDLRVIKNDIMGTDWCNATPATQKQFVPVLNSWLFYFERNLKMSMPYLSGFMFTPVDCRVWDVLNQIQTLMNLYPNLYATYPNTNGFYQRVAARPNIAAYLQNRPGPC